MDSYIKSSHVIEEKNSIFEELGHCEFFFISDEVHDNRGFEGCCLMQKVCIRGESYFLEFPSGDVGDTETYPGMKLELLIPVKINTVIGEVIETRRDEAKGATDE